RCRGTHCELAAVVVEQRAEDRRRIEAGHAAPDDGAVAPYMSCQLTVADEPEVRERHARTVAHHPWASNHRWCDTDPRDGAHGEVPDRARGWAGGADRRRLRRA